MTEKRPKRVDSATSACPDTGGFCGSGGSSLGFVLVFRRCTEKGMRDKENPVNVWAD